MKSPAMLPRRALGFGQRHWLIGVLLLAGTVLRALAWVAYQPALLYGDSFRYLDNIGVHNPAGLHPIGYDLFILGPLLSFGGLEVVSFVQHVAGLACAIGIYALALRLGAPRWLAALAAAPILLDAYEVQIEQMIMSDVWAQVLLVGILWLLLASPLPRPWQAAAAGLLLGISVVFRLVSLPLIVPAVAYLLVAGGVWRGWRTWQAWRTILVRAGALLIAFGVVVGGYAGYFYSHTGQLALSNSTGNVLYARAAGVADCATLELPERLRPACPPEPLDKRLGSDTYAHIIADPAWREKFPPGTNLSQVQRDFGTEVFKQQPVDVALAIAKDFLKSFRPWRLDTPGDVKTDRWFFTAEYQYYLHEERSRAYSVWYSGEEPSDIPAIGAFLRSYQLQGGFMPGHAHFALLVVALFAGFGLNRRARASGMRARVLLPAGFAVTLLLGAALYEFSWRYQLPALVLLPLAGALGITALIRGGKAASAPAAVAERAGQAEAEPHEAEGAESRGEDGDTTVETVKTAKTVETVETVRNGRAELNGTNGGDPANGKPEGGGGGKPEGEGGERLAPAEV